MMRPAAFALSLALLASALPRQAHAEPAVPGPVQGRFYLFIDDTIHLFVNGSQVLSRNEIWTSTQSEVVELKPGDRIVAKLKNRGGPRGFMLLFVSADLKHMVEFKGTNFRILGKPESNDFTAAELATARPAKRDSKNDRKPLPFKNRSDWVWGDLDVCTLGCQVTEAMFQPGPNKN